MVAELKKTNPAAAKALADQFYRRLAYQKEFATVQDARRAKATIESLGGEEGITELQSEITDFRTEAEEFANGDRGLLEKLHKSNPESTLKAGQHILDIFEETGNLQALDSMLLRPMVKRLQSVGLGRALVEAAKLVEDGKGQEAYDAIGRIGQWLAQVNGEAEKMGSERAKAPDPREKQLQEQRQKFDQEKQEFARTRLSNEITVANNVSLKRTLEPFFKEAGITEPEGKREFEQVIMNKVWAAMKDDKVYLRNAHNKKMQGNDAETVKFISAKFAELLPGIFRAHRNRHYPSLVRAAATPTNGAIPTNGKPVVKPAAAATAASSTGNAIRVQDAPKFDDVDWSKDPGDKLWTRGYAHLKNGKLVYFH
jgi:hypothetical protein